jgi:hypothetical protein
LLSDTLIVERVEPYLKNSEKDVAGLTGFLSSYPKQADYGYVITMVGQ